MRNRFVAAVAAVSIFVSACASTSALRSRNDEKRRVQDQANEFYIAWQEENVEKLWQLASPFLQKEQPSKARWVENIGRLFKATELLDYSDLTTVYIDEKLAVTQVNLSVMLSQGEIKSCDRTIWLRFPEGWLFYEAGLLCTYMPDKGRRRFLTRNLPDR